MYRSYYKRKVSINLALKEVFIKSTLISVTPNNSKETYFPNLNSEDLLITRHMLEEKLNNISDAFLEGLIIRTYPNSKN